MSGEICEWLEAFMAQAQVTSFGHRADNVRDAQAGNCRYGRRCPHARELREANGEWPQCCVALPTYKLQQLDINALVRGTYYLKKH